MDTTPYTDRSDESLMALYACGNAQAFAVLFARYESRFYGFMLRRVGSEQQAADLYQELFLRIHCARASYDASRPFAPWCFQIARRLVIDELRRCQRRGEEALMDDVSSDCHEFADPERQAVCRDQAAAVLDRLSDIERYVLVSAKVDGRSYGDLAAELGKSVVAIKKLASRAMLRLRAIQDPMLSAAVPATN